MHKLDQIAAGEAGKAPYGFEWKVEGTHVPYKEALAAMEARVAEIEAGKANELFWLLEHPSLYTKGTSAAEDELLSADFPVHETGRGGRFTYHGPGQRIIYAMLDLRQRGRDVRQHVTNLEQLALGVLADYGIEGSRREGRIGIWVVNQGREEKIAAIGVRVRKWITYHGLSFNLNPDLTHYRGIVPCGLAEFGVASLASLNIKTTLAELDHHFKKHAEALFGLSV